MIKVYTKPACGACDLTKQFLQRENIPFASVDITQDDDAMTEIMSRGFKSMPVVSVNDFEDSWTGFEYDKLKGITNHEKTN